MAVARSLQARAVDPTLPLCPMTAGTPVLAMLGVAAKSSQEVGVGDGDVFFWSSV
jgi:hypothetical protein